MYKHKNHWIIYKFCAKVRKCSVIVCLLATELKHSMHWVQKQIKKKLKIFVQKYKKKKLCVSIMHITQIRLVIIYKLP